MGWGGDRNLPSKEDGGDGERLDPLSTRVFGVERRAGGAGGTPLPRCSISAPPAAVG